MSEFISNATVAVVTIAYGSAAAAMFFSVFGWIV